jgi:hypothetical protein
MNRPFCYEFLHSGDAIAFQFVCSNSIHISALIVIP